MPHPRRCPALQQPNASGISEAAGAALAEATAALQRWEAEQQGAWLADEQAPRLDGAIADACDGYDSFSITASPPECAAAAASGMPLAQLAAAIADQLQGDCRLCMPAAALARLALASCRNNVRPHTCPCWCSDVAAPCSEQPGPPPHGCGQPGGSNGAGAAAVGCCQGTGPAAVWR